MYATTIEGICVSVSRASVIAGAIQMGLLVDERGGNLTVRSYPGEYDPPAVVTWSMAS